MSVMRYDTGEVLYLRLKPSRAWAYSTFPHEGITLDFSLLDELVGIEFAGSIAKTLQDNCERQSENPIKDFSG